MKLFLKHGAGAAGENYSGGAHANDVPLTIGTAPRWGPLYYYSLLVEPLKKL